MTNQTMKKIVKALAEAPKTAAVQLLRELPKPEQDEARRVFIALKLIK